MDRIPAVPGSGPQAQENFCACRLRPCFLALRRPLTVIELDSAVRRVHRNSRGAKKRSCSGDTIEQLQKRIHSLRSRLRTRGKIESAAAIILEKAHAEWWIEITVEVSEEHRYTQASAGRPGKNSSFLRQTRKRFDLARHIKLLALLP